jgi:hypothetical protein
MLSTTKGKPIAKNTAGKYNGEVICIDTSKDAVVEPWASPSYIINQILPHDVEFISISAKMKYKDRQLLMAMLKSDIGIDIEDSPLKNANKQDILNLSDKYNKAIEILERIYKKDLYLPDAEFQPIITLNAEKSAMNGEEYNHYCYLIAAASGSGKSYFCANLIKQITFQDPNKKIYLISYLDEDKVYDFLGDKLVRIPTKGDEGVENFVGSVFSKAKNRKGIDNVMPMVNSKLFNNAIVIFDDIESIQDKNIHSGVLEFQKAMLQTCRHQKTITISISHELQNWSKTKILLSEATDIVLFPASNPIQVAKFFKSQYGYEKDMINKILNMGKTSRWIQLCRKIPTYILSEKTIMLM